MFHHQRKTLLPLRTNALKNLTRTMPALQFLADEKRQNLLKKMRELSGLETMRYDSLCGVLLENLVNYCQSLPETTNSYYAQPGGLVDHALNRTEAALSLFKDFMVQDQPDLFSEEQKLWQYALYSAAILQGIGKLFVDYKVNLFDANNQLLKQWNPLLGNLVSIGSQYDYEFEKESDVEFRRRLNLLLAKALLPASGFFWIASDPHVLAVWLALLNEDLRSAGTLGAILIRADAIAIQRYYTDLGLRVGSGLDGRGALRTGTFAGGPAESLIDKEQAVGVEFLQWLTQSLESGKIMINKAPLFMVPGGMLMSQEMFQLFVREHPEYKNWLAIQKGFLSLGLHKAGADGLAVSRFEQEHNQQMHSGVVFSEYAIALPESVEVQQMSSGKIDTMSATELVHRAQYVNQFTQQHQAVAIPPLQKLTAKGQWQHIENEAPTSRLGAKTGV